MRELGKSGKLLLGVAVGIRGGDPKIFATMLLDCKKTLFSSIKVHLILDRIDYLLHYIVK